MPDYLGADQRKTKEEEKDDKPIRGRLTQAGGPGRSRTRLGPRGEAGFLARGSALCSFCAPDDLVGGGSRLSRRAFSLPHMLVQVLYSSPLDRGFYSY